MACNKYILTNTGDTTINFSYRRCTDAMWQYQIDLLPEESKNIWLIDGTFSTTLSYLNELVLEDTGVFPPTITGETPTPTPTIAVTSTPTSTIAATSTPTPTITTTPTTTPTPTPTQGYFAFVLSNGLTYIEACTSYNSGFTQTYYSNKDTLTVSPPTALWIDSGLTTLVSRLWFADGVNVYAANVNGLGSDGILNQQGFC